jgi:hypothetical protein
MSLSRQYYAANSQEEEGNYMAKDNEKATQLNNEANNFHVRLKPGAARWLRNRTTEDEPTVPAVIRKIVDKERERYALRRSRKRRGR